MVKTPTPSLFVISMREGMPTLIAVGAKPWSPSTRIAFCVKKILEGLAVPFTFLLFNAATYPGILNKPWETLPSLSAWVTVLATASAL